MVVILNFSTFTFDISITLRISQSYFIPFFLSYMLLDVDYMKQGKIIYRLNRQTAEHGSQTRQRGLGMK